MSRGLERNCAAVVRIVVMIVVMIVVIVRSRSVLLQTSKKTDT